MSSPRRAPSLLESFNFAFHGIIHVLRTQRNMRIHFLVAAFVLVAALAWGVDRLELIVLLYGARRLLLHAARLSFQHPSSGERMRLEAPLPPDLKAFA